MGIRNKYSPSAAQTKLIVQLRQKKYRAARGLFVAAGRKLVGAMLGQGQKPALLFCTPEQADYVARFTSDFSLISAAVLKKLSPQTQPSGVLGVFPIPSWPPPAPRAGELILALDQIRDPGNLGAIIRLADWFGVRSLLCSEHSVDAYNPKVVQSTMGSIARVAVHCLDLKAFLKRTPLPVCAADLRGKSPGQMPKRGGLILLMGSESHGISPQLKPQVTDFVHIPKHHPEAEVESLNVASATAILLHEIRRSG